MRATATLEISKGRKEHHVMQHWGKGSGWDGRIRTYGTLYQKQLPYHLATSQQWRDVYDGRAL